MTDIVVADENKEGDDVIIGDIHGSHAQLQKTLSTLRKEDRLILVGDLIDRGPDSLAVIKTIQRINQKQKDNKEQPCPKILVVRGNHEDMFLAMAEKIKSHGSLFQEELKINGQEWIAELSPDDLMFVEEYIKSLPYIIHVRNSYNVVHADLPFDEEKLVERIERSNLVLEEEEKAHATWSRSGKRLATYKSGNYSHPTFCGHDIGGGVREGTKHINLDVGTYFTDCTLAVRNNKNKRTACLIGR